MAQEVFGVSEWAAWSDNCVTGCSHACVYCYARERSARVGQVAWNDWPTMRVRAHRIGKGCGFKSGRGMFPTTHDITPDVLGPCLTHLEAMLNSGNHVLVVSKPHLEVVKAICSRLGLYRSQVEFRFSVGSASEATLSELEPGAPPFAERLAAARHAVANGWAVSFSCEPLLEHDLGAIRTLVSELSAIGPRSIWLGKLNHVKAVMMHNGMDSPIATRLYLLANDQHVDWSRSLQAAFGHLPAIRWKESIKRDLGIAVATEAGTDK